MAPALHSKARLTGARQPTGLRDTRRTHGTAPAAKDLLLAHQIQRLLDALPADPTKAMITARDRALLVIGFYGALRRSELVALNSGDVEVNEHALVLTLRRSKNDPDGAGRRVALLRTGSADSSPVETYQVWQRARQQAGPWPRPATTSPGAPDSGAVTQGDNWVPDGQVAGETPGTHPPPPAVDTAVFCAVDRHGRPASRRLLDRSVARIVQRSAALAGLSEMDVAGHSLRAGFATSAAAAGKSERSIMKQTGHTSLPMVRRYIREGSLYRDNATDGITL